MTDIIGAVTLDVMPGRFALCRLPPNEPTPLWANQPASFVSITRTTDECSIVAPEDIVPAGASTNRDFCGLRVRGPIPLDAIGILASIATPLAHARVSVLPIATHDTDYVFVREKDLESAIRALSAAACVIKS